MVSVRTRVYLHDGLGVRIGEVTTVRRANRKYGLDPGPHPATFSMSVSDPLAAEVDPALGRALVIEGRDYPFPWVGKIVRTRQVRSQGEVTVAAVSYEAVLQHRFLGDIAAFSGGAGDVAAEIIRQLNEFNQTGIDATRQPAWYLTPLGAGTFKGSLHDASGFDALNIVADSTGNEWWLTYEVTTTGIGVRFNIAPFRGFDAFGRASLSDGGSAQWTEATVNGLAAAFSMRVFGGPTHALQPVNQRPTGKAIAAVTELGAPHGYPRLSGLATTRPLNADEVGMVADTLRDSDQLQQAAQLSLGRMPRGVAKVLTMTAVGARGTLEWPLLAPGNIVKVVAGDAFLSGFVGPARILAVQPSEESRQLGLKLELLGPKASPELP